MTIAAAFMQDRKYSSEWDLGSLGNENRFKVERLRSPQQVGRLFAHKKGSAL
jgi:hypothetical protein